MMDATKQTGDSMPAMHIRCFQRDPSDTSAIIKEDVFASCKVDTSTTEDSTTFNALEYFANLKNSSIGQPLLHAEEITSTQILMGEKNTSLPIGTVFVADVQVSGKGRGQNTWTSPAGCLMFSFKTSFDSGETLPFVQYLVSLAIVKAIKSFPAANGVDVAIKWPNDIYVNRSTKIGGMISQSTYHENTFHIVTGTGINLDNSEPTTCINQLLPEGAPKLSRETLLAAIMDQYVEVERKFIQDGFEQFHDEYRAHWLHSDQQVQVDLARTHQALQQQQQAENSTPVPPEMRTMSIKGLTKSGGLAAIDVISQQSYELYPDGNTFDFFQGLITRKV